MATVNAEAAAAGSKVALAAALLKRLTWISSSAGKVAFEGGGIRNEFNGGNEVGGVDQLEIQTLYSGGFNGKKREAGGVRKDGLLMWQVRMRMWQVCMRSFPKKQSIRVGMVGTQNDHKEAAHRLKTRKNIYIRTLDGAVDLRRHMAKSARLANI